MYQYKVTGYSENENIFKVKTLIAKKNKNKMTPEELFSYVKEESVTNVVIHDGKLWRVACVIDSYNELCDALGDSNTVYYMINPRVINGMPCRCMRFFNSKGTDITGAIYRFVGCRLDNYLSTDGKIMMAQNTRDYNINQVIKKYQELSVKCSIHCGLLCGIRDLSWKQINWDENR